MVRRCVRGLLSQLRKRRLDSSEYWGLSELGENPPCLGQMLNRERTVFLCLVKQAENHLCVAYMMPRRIKMGILQAVRRQGANA